MSASDASDTSASERPSKSQEVGFHVKPSLLRRFRAVARDGESIHQVLRELLQGWVAQRELEGRVVDILACGDLPGRRLVLELNGIPRERIAAALATLSSQSILTLQ